MAYEVLARKWRPQQFDDVVGQEHVTRTLKNAISTSRVAHAYLFVGPRGIGKTSLSRILAKALNCVKGPTTEPCGVCGICREIASGSCLDVIEFDAASHTQVDKVREIIIDNVRYSPNRCRQKVYIVDEVHMLSSGSFNALLKTLEEPPPHVTFIFATTESHKVPATIISRCQRFDLRRISARDIVAHLGLIAKAESISITQDALLAIARGAEGGMRDAESALDQLIAFRGAKIEEEDVLNVFGLVSRKVLDDLAESVLGGDMPGLIRQIDMMDKSGKDMQRVVVELLEYFRNLLVVSSAPDAASALDILDEQAEVLKKMAGRTHPDNLLRIADLLVQAENRIRFALSRKTLLETTLIRCSRAASMVSIDDILVQIQKLKEMLAGGGQAQVESTGRSLPAPYAVREEVRQLSSETDELQVLVEKWITVVNEAAKRASAIKTTLLHGRPVEADGSRVVLAFDPAFAAQAKRLSDTPRFLSALAAGIQEVVRHPVSVECRIEGEESSTKPESVRGVARPAKLKQELAPEPAANENPPQQSQSLRRDLIENPIVKSALKIFNGRIIEIRTGRPDAGQMKE